MFIVLFPVERANQLTVMPMLRVEMSSKGQTLDEMEQVEDMKEMEQIQNEINNLIQIYVCELFHQFSCT